MEQMKSFSNIFDSAARTRVTLSPAGLLRRIPFKPDCRRARRMPKFYGHSRLERPFQAVLK
jgi:hypothetical protein